ncbi:MULTISPECIES: LexA family transcriptional regulator [unclassified Marinobacter]|uniref:LexA family transcriptional regulator n=1 Tax=unclassified Marinobacter TaxID=83889 RepID=UPI001927659C|nr:MULTISPECIES: S24 family peptidase [unclassified Marinobacter]MBL3825127.1 helix-turn-helix transcriptional regulator [Marinobacter sp. MC3]MBL3893669.1 helix-turn-helix transcriptional regulator [Marinobacter sp. MW3]
MNNQMEQTGVVGELVKAAMRLAGIESEGELSRLSGIPQPTIHRIITGESKEPRPSNLYKIAQACNVQSAAFFPAHNDEKRQQEYDFAMKSKDPEDAERYLARYVQLKSARSISKSRPSHPFRVPDYMDYSDKKESLTVEGVRDQADEIRFEGSFDLWDSDTPLGDDEVALPLFREVELAAGSGQTQVIENHGPKLRFAKSTLRRTGVQEEHAACAYVRGNSMDPVLPDGTTVGVNTAEKEIRDGKIYAIDHDGMLRIKFLYRRPGGGVKIVSQNAAEHPVEEYSAQDFAEHINIIGRVFWWSVLD